MKPRELPRVPGHWLDRFLPDEWLRAAIVELSRAEDGFRQRNARAGVVACKRAAGMALNGALRVAPRESWGRTYVEHLRALAREPDVPEVVRDAANQLCGLDSGDTGLVLLWSPATAERVLEACRTVMAHAYALVYGSDAASTPSR